MLRWANYSTLVARSCVSLIARRCSCTLPLGCGTSVMLRRIRHIDPFARQRIHNFIRRSQGGNCTALMKMRHDVVVLEDHHEAGQQSSCSAETWRLASLVLPLPDPHGKVAVMGLSKLSWQDAEHAAAMHAEHTLDALGIPLYGVASMQKMHAAQVQREGRSAPLPGAPPSPAGTPVPPALQLLGAEDATRAHCEVAPLQYRILSIESAETTTTVGKEQRASTSSSTAHTLPSAASSFATKDDPSRVTMMNRKQKMKFLRKQRCSGSGSAAEQIRVPLDESEGGEWQLCNVVTRRFSPVSHTLLLPSIIDPPAVDRVEFYFKASCCCSSSAGAFGGSEFQDRVRISQCVYDDRTFFVCELDLPILRRGENDDGGNNSAETNLLTTVVAKGKASSRERAIVLLAMHCELLIDFYGGTLHPGKQFTQREHEKTVESWGRPVGGKTGQTTTTTSPPPLPLKELHPVFNDYYYEMHRTAPLSQWEQHAYEHTTGIGRCRFMTLVNGSESGGRFTVPGIDSVEAARKLLQQVQRRLGNAMTDFFMVIDVSDQYRATCVLPLTNQRGQQSTTDWKPVGIGVGPSASVATSLCIAHCFELLNCLGVAVYSDEQLQHKYVAARKKLGLCVPSITSHIDAAAPVALLPEECDGKGVDDDQHEVSVDDDDEGGLSHCRCPTSAQWLPAGIQHSSTRSQLLPPFEDERAAAQLNPMLDFESLSDDLANSLAVTYRPMLEGMLAAKFSSGLQCLTRIPYGEAAQTVQYCPTSHGGSNLLLYTLVYNAGGAGHRSTTWTHMWVEELSQCFTAVGQALRPKESERFCVLHAVRCLNELGISMHPSDSREHEAHVQRWSRAFPRHPRVAPLEECLNYPRRKGRSSPVAGGDGAKGALRLPAGCPPLASEDLQRLLRGRSWKRQSRAGWSDSARHPPPCVEVIAART